MQMEQSTPQLLEIPKTSLVVLCGASASGKSSWARRWFGETQIVSSDRCRAMISDDEMNQSVSGAAFDLFYTIIEKRLELSRLTVADATSLTRDSRRRLLQLARRADFQCILVVFNTPYRVLQDRDARRERPVGTAVLRRHNAMLQQTLRDVQKEGFNEIYILNPEQQENLPVEIVPLRVERPEHGPFDVIGDLHGCIEELTELLRKLGYIEQEGVYRHPEGRMAVFLGDLGDRGPDSVGCFRLVMRMHEAGSALYTPGNHCNKLMRALSGHRVNIGQGLQKTLDELAALPSGEREQVTRQIRDFIAAAPPYLILDGGKLVVAHAGIRADMIGKVSRRIVDFCLYGDVTGEVDEEGKPVRREWAREYRGKPLVVYGHQVHPEIAFVNNTINIDQGCVFGGKLTAFLYPEKETISVAAHHVYYSKENGTPDDEEGVAAPQTEPARSESPPGTPATDQRTLEERAARFLSWEALTQRLTVDTTLLGKLRTGNDRATQALGTLARDGVDPRWLIYLPPTISPCESSSLESYLEHPAEVYDYFRTRGVARIVLEEKHMGSRAIVIICREPAVAQRHFGVAALGEIYTRSGRPFFAPDKRDELLTRLRNDLLPYFDRQGIDWLALDAEILPWNLKAHSLIAEQYAQTGAAAQLSRSLALSALERANTAGRPVAGLLGEMQGLYTNALAFNTVYRQYVKPVEQLSIAPFFILSRGGRNCWEHDHRWHMAQAKELATLSPLVSETGYRVVTLGAEPPEPGEIDEMQATQFWLDMTENGAEGAVFKPLASLPLHLPDDAPHFEGRWVQPAIKCRGREYLRLIYGMDYTDPSNLIRLKHRSLAAKRRNALAEWALGHEALKRFLAGEPIARYHECIIALLALETEPIDPRL